MKYTAHQWPCDCTKCMTDYIEHLTNEREMEELIRLGLQIEKATPCSDKEWLDFLDEMLPLQTQESNK